MEERNLNHTNISPGLGSELGNSAVVDGNRSTIDAVMYDKNVLCYLSVPLRTEIKTKKSFQDNKNANLFKIVVFANILDG